MLEPSLDPEVIHTETDLLVASIHIDRYLIDAMDRLEEDFTEIHSLTMQTFKQLSRNKHLLNDKVLSEKAMNIKAGPGEEVTRNLEKITSYNEQMEEIVDTPVSRLRRLCTCCDRSLTFYNAIKDASADGEVTIKAQYLASSAQDRIAILKQALGSECGCDCSNC